jgi:hypothetical protein
MRASVSYNVTAITVGLAREGLRQFGADRCYPQRALRASRRALRPAC